MMMKITNRLMQTRYTIRVSEVVGNCPEKFDHKVSRLIWSRISCASSSFQVFGPLISALAII